MTYRATHQNIVILFRIMVILFSLLMVVIYRESLPIEGKPSGVANIVRAGITAPSASIGDASINLAP